MWQSYQTPSKCFHGTKSELLILVLYEVFFKVIKMFQVVSSGKHYFRKKNWYDVLHVAIKTLLCGNKFETAKYREQVSDCCG